MNYEIPVGPPSIKRFLHRASFWRRLLCLPVMHVPKGSCWDDPALPSNMAGKAIWWFPKS